MKRSSKSGRTLKAIFSSPVVPVLIGLALILGIGYWAMQGNETTAPEPPKTNTGTTGTGTTGTGTTGTGTSGTGTTGTGTTGTGTSGTGTTGTGTSGTGTTGTGTSGTGTSGTGTSGTGTTGTGTTGTGTSGTGTSGTTAGDDAILAARARIDRSAGATKTMLVTAYYVDGLKNGQSIQPVEIRVAHDIGRIRVTVEQLLNAPSNLKLYTGLPSGTKLLGVNLKEGVATVDLSPEVAKVQGSHNATAIMSSLVYSLTEIKDVKAVQLWVNGRPAVLHGIEWAKPITRAEMDALKYFTVESLVKYSEK